MSYFYSSARSWRVGGIFIRSLLEVSERKLTLVSLELIEELRWQTNGREKGNKGDERSGNIAGERWREKN